MRPESASDFVVTVDGIGSFTFGRRNLRDSFKTTVEYARLTEQIDPVPESLHIAAEAVAALKVMTVKQPEGWDLDALDPFEEDSYVQILKVYGALRVQEEMFRSGNKAGAAEGKGEGAKS